MVNKREVEDTVMSDVEIKEKLLEVAEIYYDAEIYVNVSHTRLVRDQAEITWPIAFEAGREAERERVVGLLIALKRNGNLTRKALKLEQPTNYEAKRYWDGFSKALQRAIVVVKYPSSTAWQARKEDSDGQQKGS